MAKDIPAGYFRDQLGNVRTPTVAKIQDGKLLINYEYILEPGATTLRGTHRKLTGATCAYPERLDCDDGDGYQRCEFMKRGNGWGVWNCAARLTESIESHPMTYEKIITPPPQREKRPSIRVCPRCSGEFRPKSKYHIVCGPNCSSQTDRLVNASSLETREIA